MIGVLKYSKTIYIYETQNLKSGKQHWQKADKNYANEIKYFLVIYIYMGVKIRTHRHFRIQQNWELNRESSRNTVIHTYEHFRIM